MLQKSSTKNPNISNPRKVEVKLRFYRVALTELQGKNYEKAQRLVETRLDFNGHGDPEVRILTFLTERSGDGALLTVFDDCKVRDQG